MLELTEFQYSLVYNAFSFVVAAMGAAFVFFLLSRREVSPAHRLALTLSTLVVAIAGYHYLRIFGNWADAFTETDAGSFIQTGFFNEGYRYADWLLTVPLLIAELVLLLALDSRKKWITIARLGGAAALMIALGYPGEVSDDTTTKWIFWGLAMIPFVYIVWALFSQLGRAIDALPTQARRAVRAMRTVLLVTWLVYPVAYLVPEMGFSDATAEVLRQVGYAVADVTAKPIYGVLLFVAAVALSRSEGYRGEVGPTDGDGEREKVLVANS